MDIETVLSFYEITYNSDTTEGRGYTVVYERTTDKDEAFKLWQAAPGTYGSNQGKSINHVSYHVSDLDNKVERRSVKVFGTSYNSKTNQWTTGWL